MRAMTAEELEVLGDQLRGARNYLAALDCYREELRKHSTAAVYNKIAISELMMHHPVEAEKAARKAVHRDKHMADAWNNLGVSYYARKECFRDKKCEEAIHNYQKAIGLNPDSASYHNNLAVVYMDTDQYDRAMIEYRKAFEIDPAFFERASQNGISARMSSPQNRARFAFAMARLFAASGDLERALHFLRSAIEDGYPQIDEVYREKEFAGIINDERFVALMKDRPVAIR
jgi:tetratricopeptide (TPR) repeat protein